jgi:hypothetical protein
MDIEEVWHDGARLDECALVVSGSPDLSFVFTARDPEAHLFNYSLVDRWGSGASALVTSDQYLGVHDSSTTWAGVTSAVRELHPFEHRLLALVRARRLVEHRERIQPDPLPLRSGAHRHLPRRRNLQSSRASVS